MIPKDYISIPALAKSLGISRIAVYKKVKKGPLKSPGNVTYDGFGLLLRNGNPAPMTPIEPGTPTLYVSATGKRRMRPYASP